jgi:hypothetical protein
MSKAVAVAKIGKYALIAQAIVLVLAILATALKLGSSGGILMFISLFAGFTAFVAGVTASGLALSVRWLGLSAAALFVGFFSLLIGITF